MEEVETTDQKKGLMFHDGRHRIVWITFGLQNAQETSQRAMDVIPSTFKLKFALVDLERIVVISRSSCDHVGHVKRIQSLVRVSDISLKLMKCSIFTDTADYFCHVIPPTSPEVTTQTSNATKGLKLQLKATELCSFLELCNVFRRIKPNIACIAALLNQNFKKVQLTLFRSLSPDKLKAMHELQGKLMSPPIQSLSYAGDRYILDTNAFNVQVECVLLQEQSNWKIKPVCYWSRFLRTAEQIYDTTQHERLIIVWSVLIFHL